MNIDSISRLEKAYCIYTNKDKRMEKEASFYSPGILCVFAFISTDKQVTVEFTKCPFPSSDYAWFIDSH